MEKLNRKGSFELNFMLEVSYNSKPHQIHFVHLEIDLNTHKQIGHHPNQDDTLTMKGSDL